MTDNLILIGLVLIFFKEIRRSGESNLIDILFHFLRRHADTVVNEFQRLLFRIHKHPYLCLVVIRQGTFPHHLQFLQFRDCVTSVGNKFPHENIMIRIKPFLNDWKNIIAVNR